MSLYYATVDSLPSRFYQQQQLFSRGRDLLPQTDAATAEDANDDTGSSTTTSGQSALWQLQGWRMGRMCRNILLSTSSTDWINDVDDRRKSSRRSRLNDTASSTKSADELAVLRRTRKEGKRKALKPRQKADDVRDGSAETDERDGSQSRKKRNDEQNLSARRQTALQGYGLHRYNYGEFVETLAKEKRSLVGDECSAEMEEDRTRSQGQPESVAKRKKRLKRRSLIVECRQPDDDNESVKPRNDQQMRHYSKSPTRRRRSLSRRSNSGVSETVEKSIENDNGSRKCSRSPVKRIFQSHRSEKLMKSSTENADPEQYVTDLIQTKPGILIERMKNVKCDSLDESDSSSYNTSFNIVGDGLNKKPVLRRTDENGNFSGSTNQLSRKPISSVVVDILTMNRQRSRRCKEKRRIAGDGLAPTGDSLTSTSFNTSVDLSTVTEQTSSQETSINDEFDTMTSTGLPADCNIRYSYQRMLSPGVRAKVRKIRGKTKEGENEKKVKPQSISVDVNSLTNSVRTRQSVEKSVSSMPLTDLSATSYEHIDTSSNEIEQQPVEFPEHSKTDESVLSSPQSPYCDCRFYCKTDVRHPLKERKKHASVMQVKPRILADDPNSISKSRTASSNKEKHEDLRSSNGAAVSLLSDEGNVFDMNSFDSKRLLFESTVCSVSTALSEEHTTITTDTLSRDTKDKQKSKTPIDDDDSCVVWKSSSAATDHFVERMPQNETVTSSIVDKSVISDRKTQECRDMMSVDYMYLLYPTLSMTSYQELSPVKSEVENENRVLLSAPALSPAHSNVEENPTMLSRKLDDKVAFSSLQSEPVDKYKSPLNCGESSDSPSPSTESGKSISPVTREQISAPAQFRGVSSTDFNDAHLPQTSHEISSSERFDTPSSAASDVDMCSCVHSEGLSSSERDDDIYSANEAHYREERFLPERSDEILIQEHTVKLCSAGEHSNITASVDNKSPERLDELSTPHVSSTELQLRPSSDWVFTTSRCDEEPSNVDAKTADNTSIALTNSQRYNSDEFQHKAVDDANSMNTLSNVVDDYLHEDVDESSVILCDGSGVSRSDESTICDEETETIEHTGCQYELEIQTNPDSYTDRQAVTVIVSDPQLETERATHSTVEFDCQLLHESRIAKVFNVGSQQEVRDQQVEVETECVKQLHRISSETQTYCGEETIPSCSVNSQSDLATYMYCTGEQPLNTVQLAVDSDCLHTTHLKEFDDAKQAHNDGITKNLITDVKETFESHICFDAVDKPSNNNDEEHGAIIQSVNSNTDQLYCIADDDGKLVNNELFCQNRTAISNVSCPSNDISEFGDLQSAGPSTPNKRMADDEKRASFAETSLKCFDFSTFAFNSTRSAGKNKRRKTKRVVKRIGRSPKSRSTTKRSKSRSLSHSDVTASVNKPLLLVGRFGSVALRRTPSTALPQNNNVVVDVSAVSATSDNTSQRVSITSSFPALPAIDTILLEKFVGFFTADFDGEDDDFDDSSVSDDVSAACWRSRILRTIAWLPPVDVVYNHRQDNVCLEQGMSVLSRWSAETVSVKNMIVIDNVVVSDFAEVTSFFSEVLFYIPTNSSIYAPSCPRRHLRKSAFRQRTLEIAGESDREYRQQDDDDTIIVSVVAFDSRGRRGSSSQLVLTRTASDTRGYLEDVAAVDRENPLVHCGRMSLNRSDKEAGVIAILPRAPMTWSWSSCPSGTVFFNEELNSEEPQRPSSSPPRDVFHFESVSQCVELNHVTSPVEYFRLVTPTDMTSPPGKTQDER